MVNEIVYVCNSINNKNVRGAELKILRKNEQELYFEFGESERNIKKRFYRNIDVLNKDYSAIEKIKEELEKEPKIEEKMVEEEIVEEAPVVVETFKRKKSKRAF